MSAPAGFANLIGALSDPNYGRFASGNVGSLIGLWMQRMGVGWLTWELTESGAWLGVIAFADLFPVVLFAPIAGVLADRWQPLRVVRLAQALSVGQAVVLFALTAGDLITIHGLLVLTVAQGFFSALNQPARLAAVPSLVRPVHLPASIAVGAISFNSARFIGPAIAGALIGGVGIAAVFAATAVAYGVFLLCLAGVHTKTPARGERSGRAGLFAPLVQGISYAARHPGIGPLYGLLAAVALGCRPFSELFPGFAEAVFDAGPTGLALLTAGMGVGAIVSSLWMARRSDPRGLVRVVLLSVLGTCVTILAFAATDQLWPAVAAVTLTGLFMTPASVATLILVQSAITPDMRGRVMSLYVVVFRAVPALGALIMGFASDYVGLGWPVAGGVAATLLVLVWATGRRHAVRAALEEMPSPVER